jgi:hypothetical protein
MKRKASLALCSIAVVGITTILDAQQQDPALLLQRVRDRLLADLENLVRHTCVQTITRTYRRPSGQRLIPMPCPEVLRARASLAGEPPVQWRDRWRLDVAIAGREIYSWAGAPQFGDGKLAGLMDYGSYANGDFGPLIAGAITGSERTLYKGERVIEGRKLREYTYEVPDFRSHYYFDTDSGEIAVAYDGTLLIDPDSSDLVRLTARTAIAPAAASLSSACQIISSVDYERVRMAQRDVLIPRKTEVRMVDRLGGESVIVTSYASCREYLGESVIRFDQSAEEPRKPDQRRGETAPLPDGLTFRCRILTPLDDSAAAGDVVEASLRSPITASDGIVLAPRGAHIKGRLIRMLQSLVLVVGFESRAEAERVYEIRVRFESIERNGRPVPFGATQTPHSAALFVPRGLSILPPKAEGAGVFLFRQRNLRVRNIDSEWVTSSPKH